MDFPLDIVQFVEQRFSQSTRESVYEMLETNEVSTLRVMRAVLYLSDGSFTLLDHYVKECMTDVREVITDAEFIVGISEEPMHVRDMTLEFSHERNLGKAALKTKTEPAGQKTKTKQPGRSRANGRSAHHAFLAERKFMLGKVTYTIARKQPHIDYVCCHRERVDDIVRLPLVFVLEQLAENIVVDNIEEWY